MDSDPITRGFRLEIAALKQERDDYRVAARLAETKETAVHHAINEMRHELAALWQTVDELEWKGGHCPIQTCHRNKDWGHAPGCPIGMAKVLRMKRYSPETGVVTMEVVNG